MAAERMDEAAESQNTFTYTYEYRLLVLDEVAATTERFVEDRQRDIVNALEPRLDVLKQPLSMTWLLYWVKTGGFVAALNAERGKNSLPPLKMEVSGDAELDPHLWLKVPAAGSLFRRVDRVLVNGQLGDSDWMNSRMGAKLQDATTGEQIDLFSAKRNAIVVYTLLNTAPGAVVDLAKAMSSALAPAPSADTDGHVATAARTLAVFLSTNMKLPASADAIALQPESEVQTSMPPAVSAAVSDDDFKYRRRLAVLDSDRDNREPDNGVNANPQGPRPAEMAYFEEVRSAYAIFAADDTNRQIFPYNFFAGTAGMGKTRFGANILHELREIALQEKRNLEAKLAAQQLDSRGSHADASRAFELRDALVGTPKRSMQVMVEFNGSGNKLMHIEKQYMQTHGFAENLLTLRILLMALGCWTVDVVYKRLGISSVEALSGLLRVLDSGQLLNTSKLLRFIAHQWRARYGIDRSSNLVLVLHIDELQLLKSPAVARDMLRPLQRYVHDPSGRSDAQVDGLFVTLLLTGTRGDDLKQLMMTNASAAVKPSAVLEESSTVSKFVVYTLQPLSVKETIDMLVNDESGIFDSSVGPDARQAAASNMFFRVFAHDLGGRPRFMRMICLKSERLKHFSDSDGATKVQELAKLLQPDIDLDKNVMKKVSGVETSPTHYLRLAQLVLSGVPVNLDISEEEIKGADGEQPIALADLIFRGVVQLADGGRITMAPAVLSAILQKIGMSRLLEFPALQFYDHSFENAVNETLSARMQALARARTTQDGMTHVTVRTLLPGAVGSEALLDMNIEYDANKSAVVLEDTNAVVQAAGLTMFRRTSSGAAEEMQAGHIVKTFPGTEGVDTKVLVSAIPSLTGGQRRSVTLRRLLILLQCKGMHQVGEQDKTFTPVRFRSEVLDHVESLGIRDQTEYDVVVVFVTLRPLVLSKGYNLKLMAHVQPGSGKYTFTSDQHPRVGLLFIGRDQLPSFMPYLSERLQLSAAAVGRQGKGTTKAGSGVTKMLADLSIGSGTPSAAKAANPVPVQVASTAQAGASSAASSSAPIVTALPSRVQPPRQARKPSRSTQ
eukprot:Unigene7479_Nuclearia_a/m.22989 Unigene7479_Nuclearia_a/g.22989  ORF Unigene7479_Nuclearia_a/g.22989 Unigene7479_Nuclearia_a/m.22989 type:complete len:1068 (+) Unigene7479_Nuclearia_a:245-3448(+)